MAKCNQCDYEAKGSAFDACFSAYHDLRCPKCGTTDVDTSEENKELKGEYGYGDDNFLHLKTE